MTGKKRNTANGLVTDKKTDYLFDYYINDDKFNELLRAQWDDDVAQKIKHYEHPQLDSRVRTDSSRQIKSETVKHPRELQGGDAHREGGEVDSKDFEFSTDSVGSTNSSNVHAHKSPPYDLQRSPHLHTPRDPHLHTPRDPHLHTPRDPHLHTPRDPHLHTPRDPHHTYRSPHRGAQRSPYKNKIDASMNPGGNADLLFADHYRVNPEPAESRRARAREAYSKLEDIVRKHEVKLTRSYNTNDDPDEMEAEYSMHEERRHKHNQTKFYKQILLNIVCGVEFVNDKYNPFAFKLTDWSKQVATEMDDYTEVLEELYEKYKDRGGNMPPELKLVLMIIMSGVTYHITGVLFKDAGLTQSIKDNPNLLSKLIAPFMKNSMGLNTEPVVADQVLPNNQSILDNIRRQNVATTTPATNTQTTHSAHSAHSTEKTEVDPNLLEKKLEEQRIQFETQMKKQHEMYVAHLAHLQNAQAKPTTPLVPDINVPEQNQLLSSAVQKPRFMNEPVPLPPLIAITSPKNNTQYHTINMADDDIFTSEVKHHHQDKSDNKNDLLDLIETIDGSIDVDLSDIVSAEKKKVKNSSKQKMNSTVKPKNSITKPKNSIGKSSARKTRSDSKKKSSDVVVL